MGEISQKLAAQSARVPYVGERGPIRTNGVEMAGLIESFFSRFDTPSWWNMSKHSNEFENI